MKKRPERIWIDVDLCKEIKYKAIELNKNILDLKPEDIGLIPKKKKDGFRFEI